MIRRSTTIQRSNIDIDNTEGIEGETDDNLKLLLCSLCKNVLMRPLVCSGCQVASCTACLADWKLKDSKCPQGCQDYSYGKPSKFLMNWINKL
jgi:hypothetical protein